MYFHQSDRTIYNKMHEKILIPSKISARDVLSQRGLHSLNFKVKRTIVRPRCRKEHCNYSPGGTIPGFIILSLQRFNNKGCQKNKTHE